MSLYSRCTCIEKKNDYSLNLKDKNYFCGNSLLCYRSFYEYFGAVGL